MSDIATELKRIKTAKSNLIVALNSKGITVDANAKFDDMVTNVENATVGNSELLDSIINSSITEIDYSDITSIGNSAFYNCKSLASVSFPNVSIINIQAFGYCNLLSSISFPNVTSIGQSSFINCTSLTSVSFPNVSSIGNSAFCNCTSLTSVSFPNVSNIGEYTFDNCSKLLSVSFPNITNINGKYTFNGCIKLKTLEIGTNVTSICTLSSSNAISGYTEIIYVPDDLVDSYKSATNWSNLASKIKGISEKTE